MTIKLGVVMDPIGSINIKKDSTFAMLLEAQRRGWPISYMQQQDLFVEGGESFACMHPLQVHDNREHWFDLGTPHTGSLTELDVIFMRKDPPFDMEYIFSTYVLELAEAKGTLIVNKPQALRDANEKMFTAWFEQCTPPTLVSRRQHKLREFLERHQDVILKPLDGMGGASIFRIRPGDPNVNVIMETLSHNESRSVMAQRFIPEIERGDKRILMIDGEPVPYALARIPPPGETRGNLAVGGRGEGVALSDRDRWICEQVGPALKKRGIVFAGLDVIGDYLTEINVTSPTCIRELDKLYGLNISAQLMDAIAARLDK
jgi:glutathione synthase